MHLLIEYIVKCTRFHDTLAFFYWTSLPIQSPAPNNLIYISIDLTHTNLFTHLYIFVQVYM